MKKNNYTQITLNGSAKELPNQSMTVADLLASLHIDPTQVALEKNLQIIPKSRYAQCMIDDGDKIELVEFVGGG